jgi:chromosome segregation ATPase
MKEKINLISKELDVINDKIMDETKRLEILSNAEKLKEKIKDCKIEIEWSKIDKIKKSALDIQNQVSTVSNEIKHKQDELTLIMEESELIKQDKKNLNEENRLLQEKNSLRLEEVEKDINKKVIVIRSIGQDLEELQKEFAYKI